MNFLLKLTLRNKLTLIILTVTLFAVVLGSVGALVLELKNRKRSSVDEARLIARTVGDYSATDLAFFDKQVAKSSLQILKETPYVINAHLYDTEGDHFVSLYADPEQKRLTESAPVAKFVDNVLYVVEPIVYQGRNYGSIQLLMSTERLRQQIVTHIGVTLVLVLIVLSISLILAAKLQAVISKPIMQLTKVAKQLSEQPKYALRISTDVKGEIGTLYSAFNDMLEQITRRESDLRKSEEKWRSITQYSPDHIMLLDRDGKILFINHAIPGLTVDKMVDHPVFEFVPNRFIPLIKKCLANVLATGNPDYYEVEYDVDGGILYFEANVGPVMDNGAVVALTVSARDITERKQAHQEKLRAAKRLEMLHAIDEAILKAHSPRDIANAALEQIEELVHSHRASVALFDLEKKQMQVLAMRGASSQGIGKRIPLQGIVGDLEALRQGKVHVVNDINEIIDLPIAKALADAGEKMYINVPLIAQDQLIGTLNLGSDTANDFSEEEIDIASEVASVLAISIQQAALHEQVQIHAELLEQRVKERTAALEAANSELESFSYSVSHDLRAPLRSIDGFSQVILEDYADRLDDAGQDYLKRVRNASQRMGHLIDDMLTLSRLNRGVVKREPVALHEMVHEVINSLRETEPDRQVDFKMANDIRVNADPHLLRVVLENLLGNAWKFTAKVQHAEIEVGEKRIDGKTAIYVQDNGAGFSMDYAHKLFGAFQRLHSYKEFAGTGIGLASVQRIINRHGGEIWAAGEEGKGATFYFTLPDQVQLQEDTSTHVV
ncbi:ATP-binding protein [Kaarinaea lacus]